MRSRCSARAACAAALATALSLVSTAGRAQGVDGAALVGLLGPHAKDAFAPRSSPGMGALVRLPSGVRGADLGLREVAPGIARFWGAPAQLVAFAGAHPGLSIEVAPPLHPLL